MKARFFHEFKRAYKEAAQAVWDSATVAEDDEVYVGGAAAPVAEDDDEAEGADAMQFAIQDGHADDSAAFAARQAAESGPAPAPKQNKVSGGFKFSDGSDKSSHGAHGSTRRRRSPCTGQR